MIEAKHTPGPWRVSGHRLAVFAKLNGINVVVADCDRTLGYSESEANARLIASAPELLEYLQYAVWAHPELEKNEKLMAVIAKATGQEEGQ